MTYACYVISLADVSSDICYCRNERNRPRAEIYEIRSVYLLACAFVKWVNLGIYTESRDILRLRYVSGISQIANLRDIREHASYALTRISNRRESRARS